MRYDLRRMVYNRDSTRIPQSRRSTIHEMDELINHWVNRSTNINNRDNQR